MDCYYSVQHTYSKTFLALSDVAQIFVVQGCHYSCVKGPPRARLVERKQTSDSGHTQQIPGKIFAKEMSARDHESLVTESAVCIQNTNIIHPSTKENIRGFVRILILTQAPPSCSGSNL